MAEGEDPFAFKDKTLDANLDNDDYEYDGDYENELFFNTTRPFVPYAASTPYHGGEQNEMKTMMHEQSGLPDAANEETPLLSPNKEDALSKRLEALRYNSETGLLNLTASKNVSKEFESLLGDDFKEQQIRRTKNFIKSRYPYADVDKLVFSYSKKKSIANCCKREFGRRNTCCFKRWHWFTEKIHFNAGCKKCSWPPS